MLSLLLVWSAAAAAAHAQERVDPRALARELAAAAREGDADAFLAAALPLLAAGPAERTLRLVVEGYGELVDRSPPLDPEKHFALHGRLVPAVAQASGGRLPRTLETLRGRARRWPARLLAFDAALAGDEAEREGIALEGLDDADPRLVRRAIDVLEHSETLAAVDALLDRYLELDTPARAREPEWNRTLLAFRDALAGLLKVELTAAVDFKNYLGPRRDSADLFSPEVAKEDPTRLSLFGAPISGRNIAFVLDVSGSMMATDKIEFAPGETIVDGAPLPAERIAKHRRISRAKAELERVFGALAEDVRFNVIAYSSLVDTWRDSLVRASAEAKASAAEYVGALTAEGITVTDEALERAFADPGVDTIYLITDGAPTHRGSQGRARPVDADALIAKIHARVRALNFLRGVRIFTLGFPEAEAAFLERLARENGGVFTPIR